MLSDFTVPTGDKPTGDGLLDMFTNFVLGNSMFCAIVIIIIFGVVLIGVAGDMVSNVVGKLSLPIGFVVVAALVIGALTLFS